MSLLHPLRGLRRRFLALLMLSGAPLLAVRNEAREELARLEAATAPEAASLPELRLLRQRCQDLMRRENLFVPGSNGHRPQDTLSWDAEDMGVPGWAVPCAQLPGERLAVVGGMGRSSSESDSMRLVVADARDRVTLMHTVRKGSYGFLERPAVFGLEGGDLLLMIGNAAPKGGNDDGAPWIRRLDAKGKVKWDLKLPDMHPQGRLYDRGFVREGRQLRVLGVLHKEMQREGYWIRQWPWTGWVDLESGKLLRDSLGLEPVKP